MLKKIINTIYFLFLHPILDRLFLNYFKISVRPLSKPLSINLCTTDACNSRCKMCSIWRISRKQRQPELDFYAARKIIDTLSNWLGSFLINFAGGEPFLNKDFLKIISYAHQKKLSTSVNSNGYIINEDLARKTIKTGINNIFISLDGLEKEHDFIRGRKGSFENAIQALEYLNKYKTRNNKIYINSVISGNNLFQIDKLVMLAKRLKVDGINFQALMPDFVGEYQGGWYKSDQFWPKDKKEIMQTFNKLYRLKKQFNYFILNPVKNIKAIEKYILDPEAYQEQQTCFTGFTSMTITTTGDMQLCFFMNKIGNILKDNPEKIWKSERVKKIRSAILNCKRPCKLLPCNVISLSL